MRVLEDNVYNLSEKECSTIFQKNIIKIIFVYFINLLEKNVFFGMALAQFRMH